MFNKSFPAAQNKDISSSLKPFTIPCEKRRSKRNKSSPAYISDPLICKRKSSAPDVLEYVSPLGPSQFGPSTPFNVSKLSNHRVNKRMSNLTPSPRSSRSRSIEEEKDDFELGVSIDIESHLMTLAEPSYNTHDDQEEIFSGDKDIKMAELTLKCAKIKKKYITEKQSVSLLHQREEQLKQRLENERKRYSNLKKNFSLKDRQISEALKETNDLEQKLRKVSIDDTVTARAGKWKKDMFIPEDLHGFQEQLKKIDSSKTKLEELASQIFDKYYESKQLRDSLSETNHKTRAKYNNLLYDYGELGKFKENMQKRYDLGQDQLEAISNDLEKAVERKLQPAQNTIEMLKKEINQIREHFQGETVALNRENAELIEMFKDLENQKYGAENALKQKTKHSQMMVDKLWRYKSQVQQHELTIRLWKCFLIKETDYPHQDLNSGILQPLSRVNAEIKKEIAKENDGKGMIEMTLRIYKIPATGIIYLEVSSDCKNSIVPSLRPKLFDIREVRHLLTESGEISNRLSIVIFDQVLLLQSLQAEDIVTTLDSILEVNNQWVLEEKTDSKVKPKKIKRQRRFSLSRRRENLPAKSPSPAPSLPILLGQLQASETENTQRSSYASFFTCK